MMTTWTLIKAIARRYNEQHYSYGAATLAYMTLFAIFPFMIFLSSILSLLPNGQSILNSTLQVASEFVPQDGMSILKQVLSDTLSTRRTGLLSVGFIGAIWGAHNAVLTLSDHINSAYSIFQKRAFWKEHVLAIGLVFGTAFLLSCSFILLLISQLLENTVQKFIQGDQLLEFIWWPGRYAIILSLFIFALTITFKVLPRSHQRWTDAFPGALFTAISWIAVSLLFAVYINRFGGFTKTYGSLGAIACLLLWIYSVSLTTLLGGAMNAVLQLRRLGRDPLTIPLPPVQSRPREAA